MNRVKSGFWTAGLLIVWLSSIVCAADESALPVFVPPHTPAVVTAGRFTEDYRFGWTACNVRLRFSGTAINALVKLTRGRAAALQIVVDGVPTRMLIVTPHQTLYPLAEGLPDGEHTVELWKRTEGFQGEMQLIGFQLGEGGAPLPASPANRRMLVIGDSISCGYGNEARETSEGNTLENENGYLAYGPIAARALGAEIMVVAWSGRGMFRNRDEENDRRDVLPDLFERTLPLDPEQVWDHRRFVPHVIVINLGTNDLARGRGNVKPELDKAEFLRAYRRFLERLRGLYPDASILISIGPMAIEPIAGWLTELEAEYPNVYRLVFEKREGAEFFGGHWHPSVVMHEIMARALAEKIRAVVGW